MLPSASLEDIGLIDATGSGGGGGGSGGGGSGGGGSGGGGGGSGAAPVTLQGLTVFPQGTLSTAQGLTGTRRWYLPCEGKCASVHLKAALRAVCKSHWPDEPDCVPIMVQWGAPDEKTIVTGDVKIADLSNKLEGFDTYLIVCQYQLLHISDPWPGIGKPAHVRDSVLALRTTGGGEMLEINPQAFSGGPEKKSMAEEPQFNSRLRIPLTEYNLVCDRLTDEALCAIMQERHWQDREGTVNWDDFLGEFAGTLLFDTWTLEQTFAPDVDNCRRWRLACTLKCRQVPNVFASYPNGDHETPPVYAVGWNHDFMMRDSEHMGWTFVVMQDVRNRESGRTPHGDCPKNTVPRYPYDHFANIFCPRGLACEAAQGDDVGCGGGGSGGGGSGGGGSGGGGFRQEGRYFSPAASSSSVSEELEAIQASAAGVTRRKLAREHGDQ